MTESPESKDLLRQLNDSLHALKEPLTTYATNNPHGAQVDHESDDEVMWSQKDDATILDPRKMAESGSVLRGFLHLSWVCMFAGSLGAMSRTYRHFGHFLGKNLWNILILDFVGFLTADLVLMTCLYIMFFFHKFVAREYINVHTVWIFRAAFLLALFCSVVYICYLDRAWSYLQICCLLGHTLSMSMKLYSFSCINEVLHEKWLRANKGKACKSIGVLPDKEPLGKLARMELWKGKDLVYYPDNLTLGNFTRFLFVPSLVYQLNFPKSPRIRVSYLLEKTVSGALCSLSIYILVENWIYPVLFDLKNIHALSANIELILPFMMVALLLFYLIFECLCCVCAESTQYANRMFYDDWWNSSTFDEFARKWNKPVHHFLYLHIYQTALHQYKLSRDMANFLTFLVSSILHELSLTIICGQVQLYFFVFQMIQIPLIWLGRIPVMRRYPTLANLGFWISLLIGFPLLILIYCRRYFLTNDWQRDYPFWRKQQCF